MKKKIHTKAAQSETFWRCDQEGHDFFQISHQYPPMTSGIGGLGGFASIPPKFMCRKCGKVISA